MVSESIVTVFARQISKHVVCSEFDLFVLCEKLILEYRICKSSNSAEQYCPLFKMFDCQPFTGTSNRAAVDCGNRFIALILDLECGLKTIPVPCPFNHCENHGSCHVNILQNLSQCVCPSGKTFFLSLFAFTLCVSL